MTFNAKYGTMLNTIMAILQYPKYWKYVCDTNFSSKLNILPWIRDAAPRTVMIRIDCNINIPTLIIVHQPKNILIVSIVMQNLLFLLFYIKQKALATYLFARA